MASFNKGPAYGLSAEVKNKALLASAVCAEFYKIKEDHTVSRVLCTVHSKVTSALWNLHSERIALQEFLFDALQRKEFEQLLLARFSVVSGSWIVQRSQVEKAMYRASAGKVNLDSCSPSAQKITRPLTDIHLPLHFSGSFVEETEKDEGVACLVDVN